MVVVSLAMGATFMFGFANAATICLSLFLMMILIGFILANSSALAMASVGHGTGTAAALNGSLQFGFGAVISPIVGLGGEESATMMVVCIIGCAMLGLMALQWARPYPVSLLERTAGT